MSVHFHSKRWTNTSPAAIWPLGRYVGASTGRPGGRPVWSGDGGVLEQVTAAKASSPAAAMRSSDITGRVRWLRNAPQLRLHHGGAAESGKLVAAPGSVAWILLQVRVRRELVQGDRVQFQVRVRCRARLRAAFPRPDVGPASVLVVPDEIRPALPFPQELAAPLVQHELQVR